jgi:hypothetical protein
MPAVPARSPIPNEAGVVDVNGKEIGGIIVFVMSGYLSYLEIYSYGDPISPFPPLSQLRLVQAHT